MTTTDRCAACPHTNTRPCRKVEAVGPTQARCLFLGAGPSKVEDRTGIPYSGLAGDELTDTYLAVAGLHRADVVIGNATLCWDGTDRTPSDARVAACAAHHLPALLDRVRPEVVVLMGGATNKIADVRVSSLDRIRLDTHHGTPQWGTLPGGWTGWIWPMFEPALGMRETARMTQLLTDFKHLGQWLKSEWFPPAADLAQKDYRLARTTQQVKDYFNAYDSH